MAKSLLFDFDSLSPNLKRLLPAIDAAVDIVFDGFEGRAETYMRQNAPWTDRTSNARNGLQAKHQSVPMVSHTMVLYHTMPYGFWLEVRWSGRYAIIGPSMLHLTPELVALLVPAIDRSVKLMGAG